MTDLDRKNEAMYHLEMATTEGVSAEEAMVRTVAAHCLVQAMFGGPAPMGDWLERAHSFDAAAEAAGAIACAKRPR